MGVKQKETAISTCRDSPSTRFPFLSDVRCSVLTFRFMRLPEITLQMFSTEENVYLLYKNYTKMQEVMYLHEIYAQKIKYIVKGSIISLCCFLCGDGGRLAAIL